jgi:O-antigen ligase
VEARAEAFVAHNVFLAMIGELGWVGFFLFLFFVGGALSAGMRAGDAPATGPWTRALFAGASGYLLGDMSSGYVTSAHFFFIFGLLVAAERVRNLEWWGAAANAEASAPAQPLPALEPASEVA